MPNVVDTNVILVANGMHEDVSNQCVIECVNRLKNIASTGTLVIDDGFLILTEYQNKIRTNGSPRPGTAFVKWALQNRCNISKCEEVKINTNSIRGFDEFPDDHRLAGFDPSDRKFVAVAAAHPSSPVILQAADSKWLQWAPFLASHKISVEFICKGDIDKFKSRKNKLTNSEFF